MSRTFPILVLALLVLVLVTLWLTAPLMTNAQCESIESTCVKCHQETHSVNGTTEWHSEYGHRNTCWNCHGGNDTAQDKDFAHVGLVRHPLEDTYASCYVCHPENYRKLAERYAKTLGVTVSAREPAPRMVASLVSAESYPLVMPLDDAPAIPTNSLKSSWLWWLSSVPVGLGLAWFIRKKRLGH